MTVVTLAALAPFIALLGAVINGFFGKRLREPLPGLVGTTAVGTGFVLSLLAFFGLAAYPERTARVPLWSYLSGGPFTLDLGFVIDPLSVTLMLVITGVGLLIHVYSASYMHRDPGFSRYFSYLNLFVAAMLVLVMADSFFLMFIGWEGVGVCSFLLIGFWYAIKENADAARKAFIVNRVGDVGFLLAMFLTVRTFGTLDIASVNAAAPLVAGSAVLTVLGLLYLVAACGKSAQLPLHTWLPDAMAGPTPVSALIHAATMVTAGVYLIARTAPLFASTADASAVVAWVGGVTALAAAFAALTQNDIKKILAYSTISQLGFMFAAVGVGAYWVAIFHVLTHAFFKALLFLGAGSVIHALGGEQDVRKMGGLGKHMKITGTTSLVAVAAISGVPFFSGFFSKDAILAHVFTSELAAGYGKILLYAVLLFTAVLTAFYMFRWYYLVFAGEERVTPTARRYLHESPRMMTVPLIILAVFSVIAGYIGLPEFAFPNAVAGWLERPTVATFSHPPVWAEWLLILASVLAAALGLFLGYLRYHKGGELSVGRLTLKLPAPRAAVRTGPVVSTAQPVAPSADLRGGPVVRPKARPAPPAARLLGALRGASSSALGFDALYKRLFTRPGERLAEGFGEVDREVLDTRAGRAVRLGDLGKSVAELQSGFVRAYALLMLVGLAALVLVVVFTQVVG